MEAEAFFIVGDKFIGYRYNNTLVENRSYWTGYQWGAKCVARPYTTIEEANNVKTVNRLYTNFWNRPKTSVVKETIGHNIHNPNKCKEAMQFD